MQIVHLPQDFFEVRLFQKPGETSAEIFHLLRDDTKGKILDNSTSPLVIGQNIRFWAIQPVGSADEGNITSYASLKSRVLAGAVPTLTFRYNDPVNGDDHAGAFVASPVARIQDIGLSTERIEVYLDVVTFYGPHMKVQDWGLITYFARSQHTPDKEGKDFSFNVLVQTRVEVLLADPSAFAKKGQVIENNAFFLNWGETAWGFDHYSNGNRHVLATSTDKSVDVGGRASDFDVLLKDFPGEYDNYAEWESDVEKNVSANRQHAHLHSIFYGPVNLPAFGDHIFYVQQYEDGNPRKIYRQRLYKFEDSGVDFVLSFYDFKNGSKYIDAQKHPEILSNLTPNDMNQVTPKCNVHINRSPDGIFRGQTTDECVVIDHITKTAIRIKDNNEFGPNFVSIHERGYDAKTGALIFGNPTPDVLNRTRAARLFQGYVAVEEAPGQFFLMSNVSIWDVGQIVPVITDNGKKTKFSLELAYCTYPNGDNVLKVAVHEAGYTNEGLVRPVAYSWSPPEANQAGINLRYIQAGFSLVNPTDE